MGCSTETGRCSHQPAALASMLCSQASAADHCFVLQHRYQETDTEDAEATFAAAPRGLGLEEDYRKVCPAVTLLL